MEYKKQYGQNFLRNGRFASVLVDALSLKEGDSVIEIGPGEGILTKQLLEKGVKVIAIEIDYDLLANLIKRFGRYPNFKIVNQDFLQLNIGELLEKFEVEKEIKVCGNLPFNISKRIIDKLLNFHSEQERYKVIKMAFILQDEVAKEYAADAPKATFLSNYANLFADIKKLQSIPSVQFTPKPKVNGGILVISPHEVDKERLAEIKKFIRIGFSAPRKVLIRNLQNSRKYKREELENAFNELSFNNMKRASEMSLDEWDDLYKKLETKAKDTLPDPQSADLK